MVALKLAIRVTVYFGDGHAQLNLYGFTNLVQHLLPRIRNDYNNEVIWDSSIRIVIEAVINR
jgi:hypothetical protein